MTKKVKKRAEIIISIVCSVLIVVMIALVGYLTYCNMSGSVAFIGKRAFVKIVSASMEPLIPTNEYIYVEKLAKEDISNIKVGNVIIFYSRDPAIYGSLNTHRVVAIINGDNGTEFVTKGDNNSVNDSLTVKASDVVGMYIKNLPSITKFADFFTGKITFLLLILIPSFILVVICVIDVIKKSRQVKMELLVEKQVIMFKKTGYTPENPPDKNTRTNIEENKKNV